MLETQNLPTPFGPDFLRGIADVSGGQRGDPQMTTLPDGCVVVVWADNRSSEEDRFGIGRQIFYPDGTLLGEIF